MTKKSYLYLKYGQIWPSSPIFVIFAAQSYIVICFLVLKHENKSSEPLCNDKLRSNVSLAAKMLFKLIIWLVFRIWKRPQGVLRDWTTDKMCQNQLNAIKT